MKIRLHTILLLKLKKYILSPTVSGFGILPAIPGFLQKSDLPDDSDHAGVGPTNALNGCDAAGEYNHVTPAAISADFLLPCPVHTHHTSSSLSVNAAIRSYLNTDPASTSCVIHQGMKFPCISDLKRFKVTPHHLRRRPHIFSSHRPTYLRKASSISIPVHHHEEH